MKEPATSSVSLQSHAPLGSLADELAGGTGLHRPLCVTLENAVLRTDILWESVLVLLRKRPWLLLLMPFWWMGGRDRIRRAVGKRVTLEASALPYRTELVEMLRSSAQKGRRIVLVTRTDVRLALAVADHLALFDEVMDGGPGQDARTLRQSLEARFGSTGFDYIGASAADLPVLQASQQGYLIGVDRALASRAVGRASRVRVLSTRRGLLSGIIKVMRPHQWTKNALVVLPLLLAPGLPSLDHLVSAALAALAFSLCASAGYVFNDLIDVEADRAHRTKRARPFASGDLPVLYGPPLFVGLLAASFGLAFAALPLNFLWMLAIYFVMTLVYSSFLKSKLMADVVVLAGLYTHRVFAGGVATGIPISAWLLAFSMFMFLSLAFAKRYVELRQSTSTGQLKSRGYHTRDLEMVASMGPTAGYLAVLVFCLYVDSNVVAERYRAPMVLWFMAPVLLYWISRIWFLAHRGEMQDDPVKFALTDSRSWVCAVFVALVAAAARFWPG
jgi:4-hydroxybenzoate polyprenyltransferase